MVPALHKFGFWFMKRIATYPDIFIANMIVQEK